jgi:hypothetical protein
MPWYTPRPTGQGPELHNDENKSNRQMKSAPQDEAPQHGKPPSQSEMLPLTAHLTPTKHDCVAAHTDGELDFPGSWVAMDEDLVFQQSQHPIRRQRKAYPTFSRLSPAGSS